MNIPGITIIGLGALGSALAEAFALHNLDLESVYNRDQQQAQAVAGNHKIATSSSFPSEAEQLGELVFLTVSDAAIAEIADKLTRLRGSFSGRTFVHCSGNESAAILAGLKEKGARIASMHPLQTFNKHSGVNDFNNIYFTLQGDDLAFPMLENVAKLMGARILTVNEEQKSHLHAAAVIASNYLITLLDAATETGGLSGLDKKQVREALYPLVGTTFKNFRSTSFKEAISGPIVRGDAETVSAHLQLLDNQKELRALYTVLGLQTVRKAEKTGKLEQASANEIRRLLNKTEE